MNRAQGNNAGRLTSDQFMQALMNSRKRFLWKSEQRSLKLPLWTELSVARIWDQATQLPRFLEYIPDDWSLQQPKKIERNFFFGVLISLAPEFVQQLVLDIRSQRMEQQANRVQRPQVMGMGPEWAEQLLSQPFVSSRQGGGSSVLIQRQQPVQRRQPQPRQILQPGVTMQQYIQHRADQGNPVDPADQQYQPQQQQQFQQPAGNANNAPPQQPPHTGAQQQQQHQRERSPFERGPVQLMNQAVANQNAGNQNQEQIISRQSNDNQAQQQPPTNRQSLGLGQIQEEVFDDAASQQTVVMNQQTDIVDQQEPAIRYGAEKQSISNQLELASMVSDHNSVMGSSPVKSSRVMATRKTKAKNKADE